MGTVPLAPSNGIEIEYETLGDRGATPLLLVMGLGAQLTTWPEEFCAQLVDRGYFVIRYDNRDCGLSTKFDRAALPDLWAILCGDLATAPYRVENMAADAAGLLEHLGVASAHLVGASMGGMISQALAIHHPWRVRSLCSIMSTTGDPTVGQPSPEVIEAMLQPAPATRAEAIERSVTGSRMIGSPGFAFDEARTRQLATAAYDRSYCPEGVLRQLAAILASPDRTAELGHVSVPTVVVHGDSDPMVDPSGGEATAAAVPGAELVVVRGLGHDLPPQVWPTLVDAACRATGLAEA